MFLKSKPNKQKGFTLIELLVVISIISLLSSVVLSSLNSARAKARDARRVSDIHQIGLAIQLYIDTNGNCPNPGGYASSWMIAPNPNTRWTTLETLLAPYITKLTGDPKNNTGDPWFDNGYSYGYMCNTSTGKWDLVGQFEIKSNPARCEIRDYKYHAWGNETSWCLPFWVDTGIGGPWSRYLFSDH